MTPTPQPYPAYKPSGVPWLGDVPERRRRSIRLLGFDYSQPGVYFITVCTRDRACLLGNVVAGRMRSSEAGRLVQDVWDGLPSHYPHVRSDGRLYHHAQPRARHRVPGRGRFERRGRFETCPYYLPAPMWVRIPCATAYPRSSGPSRRFRPGASTPFSVPLAARSGNATTMNTSFGTTTP